jgi:hypothetical protein
MARCFVVMGFGKKTDYATGRMIDLDKSYRVLIKPVLKDLGVECVRADEVRHSGIIDVPMYEQLIAADVVIADLSTANLNAVYELGIRHALRPWTTVVIAENKLAYPFDLNHVVFNTYALSQAGDAIDAEEADRFKTALKQQLQAVLANAATDSPVYTFLHGLQAPPWPVVSGGAAGVPGAGGGVGTAPSASGAAVPAAGSQSSLPLRAMIAEGEAAIAAGQFAVARDKFNAVLDFARLVPDAKPFLEEPYLIQRLALATYKNKQPDEVSALKAALELLGKLNPSESNDPETVGLAGAIEKGLYDKGQGADHLALSIWYYGRGYYLRNDWYNGINLAYLLNVRSDSALDTTREDRIADLVFANRLRRDVLKLCDRDLETYRKLEQSAASSGVQLERADRERKFWCLATKAEALFGLGELDAFTQTRTEANAYASANNLAGWMMGSFLTQVGRLKAILDKHGDLMNPSWPREAAKALALA